MPGQPQLRHVNPHQRRGWLYLAVCRLSTTKAGMWLAEKFAWKLDPYVLSLTKGRFGSTGPVASAVLETRGARTERRRRTATLYFHDGDDVIIVASKRGEPKHPAWYLNLRKNPDVVFGGLQFHGETVTEEAERERLWDLADRVFPQFALYREWAAQASRTIPIVRLIRNDG